MSSEKSFNSVLEFHCRRLISLWGKSDTSRRALEESTNVRGPALAATAPGTTRNKSSYYAGQDDLENKNSIPSAMRFQYNGKKRKDMGSTNATTRAEHEHEQDQDQNHQSTTRTSTKETSRRTVSPRFTKKKRRNVSPASAADMHFDGSRNCRTSSKRLAGDEQKQNNKTRIVAADASVVLAASSAPALVSLADNFDFLDSYFTESMEDDQLSLLSPEVNLDEFDILNLMCW